jgi:O-antigen ligase
MSLFKTRHLLLPLTVLGFVGVAVTFLSPVFTTSNRWALLGLLLLYLLANGVFWRPLRSGFGLFTLGYAVWSLGTVLWSEVLLLSAMKAVAFILVSFTCLAAGQLWVRQHEHERALDFLLPLMMTALLAGVLGRFSAQAVDVSGNMRMYQGLVAGSNMFGSMLAMCFPLLFWKCWSHWNRRSSRWWWCLLALVAFYYLLAASSRAAILITLITLSGLFMALSLTRRLQIIVLAVTVLGNAFMIAPGRFEAAQQQYIYKQATQEQGVLFTRENVWRISLEQARKGGWFGGGFGVTIGGSQTFDGGLTAVGYGREKGNSQLAIVEETGLIGIAIYALSLVALFSRLWQRLRRSERGAQRVLLALVTAGLLGMLVGSVFEAWWVAPGSPESMYFWTLAGVALGLSEARGRLPRAAGLPVRRHAGSVLPLGS